jgi:hypothetical protein
MPEFMLWFTTKSASEAIGNESLKFDLMQSSQLTVAAKGNALLLKERDRQFSVVNCDLHH